jgi:transcriptional regulator with XRE-family HTH domain
MAIRNASARPATDIDILIGKRIRARRIEQKMSQATLGEKIGVSFQQVQKYEKGSNQVSPRMMTDIAAALNTTTQQLFTAPDGIAPDVYSPGLNFLATPDGAKIARSFLFITDPQRRAAISNFVLQMAGGEQLQAAE